MPRVNGLVIAAVACGLVSAYCGLHAPVNDDDVYHLHSIWLVAHGAVPYRDFFEIHPPGLWLLASPLIHGVVVPSHYVIGARLLIAVALAALAILAGRTVRTRGVQTAVLTICLLGIASYCQLWVFRVEYVAALLFMVHVALLAHWADRPTRRLSAVLAAATLTLGASMTVRLLPFLVVQPFVLLACAPGRRLQGLLWVSGALVGAAPALLYLTVHGVWGEMVHWAFRFVASGDVVSWGIEVGRAEWVLGCLGVVSLALLWPAAHLSAGRRLTLAGAWGVALLFHIANPHKIDYAAIYFLLTTSLLLTATVPLINRRQPVIRRDAALVTVGVGVVFFARLLLGLAPAADRSTQALQLRVLDWLRVVAADEPVVLVAPYHPMTVRDATDIQQAGHYALWITRPDVQARLQGIAATLLRTPPPVVAADPWPEHTSERDLVAWLQHTGVLSETDASALRTLLAERYERVGFPSLSTAHGLAFGHEFWVRRDRLMAAPPPTTVGSGG